jgi:hypothetical protein
VVVMIRTSPNVNPGTVLIELGTVASREE